MLIVATGLLLPKGMNYSASSLWCKGQDPYQATVYPKKYAHGFCFAVLCCGYTLTDFPISIRLTSLVLWQSNDCPSASKATLMNMDKYFIWIHYERLHNHNKAKHNKTVCIFLGIYCMCCDYPPMAKLKRRLLFGMVELIHTRENMVCNTCSNAIIVDIIYTGGR